MADSDHSVVINIHTDADLAAITAYRDALMKMQAGVKEGSSEHAELNDKILECNQAILNGSKAVEEGGEHIAKFNIHSREMHMALRMAGSQMGEMGHLLHFIFNPEMLMLAGGVMIFRELAKAANEYTEAIKANVKVSIEFSEIAAASSRAAQAEFNKQNAAWELTLQHLHDGIDSMSDSMNAQIAIQKTALQGTNELAAAQETLNAAIIAGKVARGEITPEQAKATTAKDKLESERDKVNREFEEQADEIKKKRNLALEEISKGHAAQAHADELAAGEGKDVNEQLAAAKARKAALEEQNKSLKADYESKQGDVQAIRDAAAAAKSGSGASWADKLAANFTLAKYYTMHPIIGPDKALAEDQKRADMAKKQYENAVGSFDEDIAKLEAKKASIDKQIEADRETYKTKEALNTSLAKEVAASEAELAQRMDFWTKKYAIEMQIIETEAHDAKVEHDMKLAKARQNVEAQHGMGTAPPSAGMTPLQLSDYDIIVAERTMNQAATYVTGMPGADRAIAALRKQSVILQSFLDAHTKFKDEHEANYDIMETELNLLKMRVEELLGHVGI